VPGFSKKAVRYHLLGSFSAILGGPECLMLALGGPIELKPGVFSWLEVKGQKS